MKTRTYAGIPEEFAGLARAEIVLIPVPYDATSTWVKGADKGPMAFLEASENMELYDIETDSEVFRKGIFLAESVGENLSPEELVNEVHRVTKSFINKKKFVTIIGGEHSLSIGAIRAFNDMVDNLTVLQIDAHADLRKTYDGSPYNHACAMYEASQNTNLVQVGIRSMDSLEKSAMDNEKTYFAHEMVLSDSWMEEAIDQMTENVFITFDLDAFDPSIMPSTGTPEPGGLLWYETLDFLQQVFREKTVVGFDIVELCPNEYDKSSNMLAAKLYYKMLSYKFHAQEFEDPYEEDYKLPNRFEKLRDLDEDDE
jgi:agmatinase